MLREVERRLHRLAKDAVGASVPVVWVPYDGPADVYPRVAIQELTGPDDMSEGLSPERLAVLTFTFEAGQVRVIVANHLFTASAADADAAAQAFRDQLASRRPEWAVGGTGAVVTVSGVPQTPILAGHSAAHYGATMTETLGAEVVAETLTRQTTAQYTVFSTTPRGSDPTGAKAIAEQVCDAIRGSHLTGESIGVDILRRLPVYQVPTERAGYVYQVVIEVSVKWRQPKTHSALDDLGRIECVRIPGLDLEVIKP